MSWPMLEAIGFLGIIFFLLYYYSMSKFEFWQKRGIKGPKPLPFVGNYLDVFLGKASFSDCFTKAYYDYKEEPMIGIYGGHIPLLVLRDPEFIKDILIKDFNKFPDRTLHAAREVEPLSEGLFRIEGKRWKPLRAKLSPVFTSGKLKEMFHLVLECSDHFEEYMEKLVEMGDPIDCREISAKFTTDVIGSCAFGIEMNALASEDSEFRKMGKKAFKTDFKSVLKDRLRDYSLAYRLIGPFLIDHDIHPFFIKITREAIDYRIKNNVRRHDFVDTLVDMKLHPDKVGIEVVDDILLASQSFVFFIAGFETSAVTMANALYEMARHPSIQEKVRAEIKHVLQQTNGVITYDCIKEMKYLDACFQETLRKYPPVLWLSRTAAEEYTFRGTKCTIPPGQKVYLPIYAIQKDPDIYPNPDAFDPERFMDNNDKSRHPMHFLPFGDGPRNCIGIRFAKLQSKVGIIRTLAKCRVETCEKTFKEYTLDKKSLFVLQPAHEMYLKMSKLEA